METINSFMGVIKPIAELLYFVSGIGMALFAYLGLQQIAILKGTSVVQAKRDALRLTSEQCSIYFERIVPLQNAFDRKLKEKNIKYFEGWTVEVKGGSVSLSRKTPPNGDGLVEIAADFAFMNNMEAFAVYFISRVADESVAYNTIGKTFIRSCEDVMPWLLQARESGYYKNLVALYAMWKVRFENEKLAAEKLSIEKKLEGVKTNFQVPIGAS